MGSGKCVLVQYMTSSHCLLPIVCAFASRVLTLSPDSRASVLGLMSWVHGLCMLFDSRVKWIGSSSIDPTIPKIAWLFPVNSFGSALQGMLLALRSRATQDLWPPRPRTPPVHLSWNARTAMLQPRRMPAAALPRRATEYAVNGLNPDSEACRKATSS